MKGDAVARSIRPVKRADRTKTMDKCKTCLARYICDREYEWECQTHYFLHYMADKQKIKELEKEKQYNDRT